MDEFNLIKKYFLPLTENRDEALGLSNDAAVFTCGPEEELVITSDNLVADVHFFADMDPGDIARRALRVNVSDLVAMGAEPYFYQLSFTFPKEPEEPWVKAFCDGLLDDQKALNIFCSGGNTTKASGPLNIAITAIGRVPKGKSLPRNAAKAGQNLCLLGVVGDGHLGLLQRLGKLQTEDVDYFHAAYIPPRPFIEGTTLLRDYAKAAIDISDGLLADLSHICETSDCGAEIDLTAALFSPQAQKLIDQGHIDIETLLSGGDDYQLLLAVDEDDTPALIKGAKALGRDISVIGQFIEPKEIYGLDETGDKHSFAKKGWTHF